MSGYTASIAPEAEEEDGSYLLEHHVNAGAGTGDFLGLSFQDLRFTINAKSILDGVDAWLPKGKLLAVLGPSGAYPTVHRCSCVAEVTRFLLQARGRRRCSTFSPRSARPAASRAWPWRT